MDNFKAILTKPSHMEDKGLAVASIKEIVHSIGDLSLGTDVEVLWMQKFEQLDGQQNFNFFRADSLFPKAGLYGTDGRSTQGEWRVTPASDVRVFTENVKDMITMCKTYIAVKQQDNPALMSIYPYGMGVYSIIADKKLQIPESIGLHIHFGGQFRTETKVKKCVAALDGLLAPIVRMFEPELGAHIRTGCGYYGDLSDYKIKPYGFEYRTLPSCIDNKDVFVGSFALAKAIVFEVVHGGYIKEEDLQHFTIPKARQHDRGLLRVLAKKAHMYIKTKCRFYHVYQTEIDTLFSLVFDKDASKLFCTHEDIFSTWDIGCDFTSEALVDKMRRDKLLVPAKSIPGYVGAESETILASSQRNKMVVFNCGDTPW